MTSGWLIIDKPLGMTSNQVLGRVKRLYRETYGVKKPPKMGFSGTLDPLASGVLPIALGEALKTMSFMTFSQKEYTFQIAFGKRTQTEDAEGDVIETSPHRPTRDDILNILPSFTGEIQQTPPIYSALKVDGKRAYDLARKGEVVTLKSRTVTIDALTLLQVDDADHATFHVVCSAGTYIRSLGRDVAHALGTVGHLSSLRRNRVGFFCENHTITLENLEKKLYADCVFPTYPVGIGLDDILAVPITMDMYESLYQGKKLRMSGGVHDLDDAALDHGFIEGGEGSVVALWMDQQFVGFAEYHVGILSPKRMICLNTKGID